MVDVQKLEPVAVEQDQDWIAALLLGTVNAPEQEIYRVARLIAERARPTTDRSLGAEAVEVLRWCDHVERFAYERFGFGMNASPHMLSAAVRKLLAATPPVPAISDDARSAFYAESTVANDLLPGTQVVSIDGFLRAVGRLAGHAISEGGRSPVIGVARCDMRRGQAITEDMVDDDGNGANVAFARRLLAFVDAPTISGEGEKLREAEAEALLYLDKYNLMTKTKRDAIRSALATPDAAPIGSDDANDVERQDAQVAMSLIVEAATLEEAQSVAAAFLGGAQ